MKQNKNHSLHLSKFTFLYTLNAVSFVLIAGLGYVSYLQWKAYVQVRDQPTTISHMIVRAVEGLTRPIPIEAQTGTGYLHETRISLPVSSDLRASDFVYSYQPAQSEGDFQETLQLAYKPRIEQAKVKVISALKVNDALGWVPELQACARGYKIFFALQDETSDLKIFEKRLQDGRQIFVYKENACMEDNHQEIVSYLQKIESY